MPTPNEMAFARVFPCALSAASRACAPAAALSALAHASASLDALAGKKARIASPMISSTCPPLLHHGAGGAIEIDIEQIEEGFNGKRVGKAGRIAQVAVPKRRGESLASAALDQSRQDAPADQRTMEGVERVAGNLVLDDHPERERERCKHLAH